MGALLGLFRRRSRRAFGSSTAFLVTLRWTTLLLVGLPVPFLGFGLVGLLPLRRSGGPGSCRWGLLRVGPLLRGLFGCLRT